MTVLSVKLACGLYLLNHHNCYEIKTKTLTIPLCLTRSGAVSIAYVLASPTF